jgi:hypothetical protein
VPDAPCDDLTHGVNIGQALKSEAVWWRRSYDATDAASTFIRLAKLDRFHGVPSGMYQADEHLAGKIPSHGTETCAVVEAVVSLAVSAAILGDASLYERAEKVVYNAMPAALTKNMWERVYLQASNEFVAENQNPFPWFTDGSDAGAYSLEGNYGCCTANMHAGWPKFTQRAVGSSVADGGVVVAMWAPVNATVAGVASVQITTDYPFGDEATVVVAPSGGAAVPVLLRIPSWATSAALSIDGGEAIPLAGSNGTFYATSTAAGGAPTTFTVAFNPAILLTPFANGTVSVSRGALVYSLWVGQNITVTAQYAYQSQDLAVVNTVPWNVALVADPSDPAASLTFTRASAPGPVPYNSTDIPQTITGMGRLVPGWAVVKGAPDAPPASPACAANGACGQPFPITLVPFGSTHVRMTVLPLA